MKKTLAIEHNYERYIKNNINFRRLELSVVSDDIIYAYNFNGSIRTKLNTGDSVGKLISPVLYKIEGIENTKNYPAGHFLRTSKGLISIYEISKPGIKKDVMEIEYTTLKRLNDFIKTVAPVKLYFGDMYVNNIYSVLKVPGFPKADFFIYGKRDKLYISHKGGQTPQSFLQISGITSKSIPPKFDEIKAFLMSVSGLCMKNNHRLPYAVYREIENSEILKYSIFGYDYGKQFGYNNVHMLGQGNPIFENYKDGIKLSWSGHEVINNDSDYKKMMIGGYKLVFGAYKAMGRNITIDGRKFASGIRTGIFTIAKMKEFNSREI
jgi:hypothetical protein